MLLTRGGTLGSPELGTLQVDGRRRPGPTWTPEFLIVRCRNAEQLAVGLGRTRTGKIVVRKWVTRRRSWSGWRLIIPATDVLRPATAFDLERFDPSMIGLRPDERPPVA